MRPKLINIIKTDYFALLGVIGLLVGGFFILDVYYLQIIPKLSRRSDSDVYENPMIMVAIGLCLILLCSLIFVMRVKSIYNYFSEGTEVRGVITNIVFFKDRGKITYQYQNNNENHQSSIAVHKCKKTKSMQTGESVKVILKRDLPRKSIIKDLYI